MAINKKIFKTFLNGYMSRGMSMEEAYRYMLQQHALDASVSGIPAQVDKLVNAGVPFERALQIAQDIILDNNFDSYRAALQDNRDRARRQVYRSPEPNGRVNVDDIIRDTLNNKPELGNGYYPPMGMSTFPNLQRSQYSVIPEQPITEGMSPTPSQYPYELDSEANQNLAPEGYTPIVSRNSTPIRGFPISADAPTADVSSNVSTPAAESNTMKVYDTKTGTTNTYNSSTGELISTSNAKQSPSVNSVVKRANTPRVQQKRTTVTPPPAAVTPSAPVVNTPASVTRPVMPAPNKMSLASAYKRDLWNLINSKGISSPAEAVQRGIIPAEYLNLF